jgi:hypothetical protein
MPTAATAAVTSITIAMYCMIRYKCKWMPDDCREGWLALDSREQALRSPVRTCAHCLELGNASGMFSAGVMEAWESKCYCYQYQY